MTLIVKDKNHFILYSPIGLITNRVFCFTAVWCKGSMAVSKTVGTGSKPVIVATWAIGRAVKCNGLQIRTIVGSNPTLPSFGSDAQVG